jgi:predicted secreted protein
MAASRARIGYGTLLQRRLSTSPDVWQTIAERVTIGGPGMSRDAPDVTHMDSDDGWREFIAGLKDGGEISIEGNFIPEDESHNAETGLLSEFSSDVRMRWQLVFPGESPRVTWGGEGILTNFEPGMPVDDKIEFSATIKVSGKPTLA